MKSTISSARAVAPAMAHEGRVLAGILLALTAIYGVLFLRYFPTEAGAIGSDYSIYFPDLLVGYYWFLQNGILAIPWFSPAQCGGFPYFPDLNAAYLSAPQFLTFAFGPLGAVRIVLIGFAVIGFLGAFALLRRSFLASLPAAVMASAFFMFNGYFAYRLLAGHLTFHAFMVTPVIAAALLPPPGRRPAFPAAIFRIGLAAFCIAYMFEAGMIHGLLPAILSVAIVLLMQAFIFGWSRFPWVGFAAAGAFALALTAAKLASSIALAVTFPRDQYPLPGASSLLRLIGVVLRTLFLSPPEDARDLFANRVFAMQRHEWEYGVSPAPFLFIAAFAVFALIRLIGRPASRKKWTAIRAASLAGILVLLFLPLALNWYALPGWNGFLKSLPFIRNSNQLVRWFSTYIPIAALLAGLALDRLTLPVWARRFGAPALAASGILLMLCWNAFADRSFYAEQAYSPAAIEAAYKKAATTGIVPPIQDIVVSRDDSGQIVTAIDRNDRMAAGLSQLACYQPMLGYGLEYFPVKSLHPGAALRATDGELNIKNPACYLFPNENKCMPGDQFSAFQEDDARRFLSYRPYPFAMPAWQHIADGLGLVTFIAWIAGMGWAGARLFAARADRRRMHGLR